MKLIAYDIVDKRLREIKKIIPVGIDCHLKVYVKGKKRPLKHYSNMTNDEVYLLRQSIGVKTVYIKLSDMSKFKVNER